MVPYSLSGNMVNMPQTFRTQKPTLNPTFLTCKSNGSLVKRALTRNWLDQIHLHQKPLSNGYWSFKIGELESLIETFLNCTLKLQFACQELTMSSPHLSQLTIIPSLTLEMWQLGRIKSLKIRG